MGFYYHKTPLAEQFSIGKMKKKHPVPNEKKLFQTEKTKSSSENELLTSLRHYKKRFFSL